jgi:hypothetical protein
MAPTLVKEKSKAKPVYLADSVRSEYIPGIEQTYVVIRRFQLAQLCELGN